jgi:3-oxoacyl-[acyl-carrier protein] reductase
MKLNDQVAVVTGGTAGIGKAIVEKFAKEGAKVAFFGRNEERGQQIAKETPNCEFYQVDVANTEQVKLAMEEIIKKWGKIDILVNNAGITRDNLLLKMTEEDWDIIMAINVKSCYNSCRAVTRTMLKAKKGKIINMGSVVGLTGNAGQMNYAASKAAVIGLTKALAKELASRNICVNCIAPGYIDTQMTSEMTEVQTEALIKSIPLGRMGKPEDIANMALFLSSSDSDYITGQVFTVDGGMVI